MAEMAKTYDPTDIEKRLYKKWLDNGYFKASSDSKKEPYSIVIPPPNITGMLHMGHVLNNTLQDVFIRWHKLKGFEACWIPGTDHASIATEAKVTEMLTAMGEDKQEIGREKFLEKAWEWREKYGKIIIDQLKELGCACDWDRENFTMDEDYSKRVIHAFVDLYNKGLIYKGYRLVNWCPVSQSVISDEEVEFEEKQGKLWYFKYPVKDSAEFVTIATTRPETLLGDTAVAVNPEDDRFKHLIGKMLILPIVNREIPVIADEMVDKDFGTGCVKVTPAHDPNDYLTGKKHDLPMINIMNVDATLNNNVPEEYRGLDRYVARKKIVADLEKLELVAKIENYVHKVGLSQRGHVPIEYLLSEQWYIAMQKITEPALQVVRDGKIKFHPEKWTKTYYHWLENVQDWCISRQLWWGHRIPVYYCSHEGCSDVIMCQEDAPTVCSKCGKSEFLYQDKDVLDTWASSWLWPYAVHRNQKDEDYFYPTNLLITGPDIIFFWVARMIMAGLEYKKEIPFKDVYFNGIVRDEKGRKMSKSLGNSPDPIDVIAKYGADAIRFTMIRLTPTGNDVMFSEDKCEVGRNFANKVWNAARFLEMHKEKFGTIDQKQHLITLEDRWINSRYENTLKAVHSFVASFELNEAAKAIYEFIWNDFCDWYIEMAKSRLNSDDEATKKTVLENAYYLFDRALRVLHPFMPFITEEIWCAIKDDANIESIMLSEIKDPQEFLIDADLENTIQMIQDFIARIRNIRAENNISPAVSLNLIVKSEDANLQKAADLIKFMAKLDKIEFNPAAVTDPIASAFVSSGIEAFVPLRDFIDIEKEKIKINKEIMRLEGINLGIQNKLSNPEFTGRAPAVVIEKENIKLQENLRTIAKLQANLEIYK